MFAIALGFLFARQRNTYEIDTEHAHISTVLFLAANRGPPYITDESNRFGGQLWARNL